MGALVSIVLARSCAWVRILDNSGPVVRSGPDFSNYQVVSRLAVGSIPLAVRAKRLGGGGWQFSATVGVARIFQRWGTELASGASQKIFAN